MYFILLLGSFSVPFLYSFESKMRFIKHWKSVFFSIFIVAAVFLIWDVIFTHHGVWGFNSKYFMGLLLFKLPIEEWLFFFLITYASIFIHYSFIFFFPHAKVKNELIKPFLILLMPIVILVMFINADKAYTFVNACFLLMALVMAWFDRFESIRYFAITYFIVLIPFLFVNGVLTGSFIEEPIVWYNNNENLGIRFFTIPIEDFGYTFSLIFFNIWLIERFKTKFN